MYVSDWVEFTWDGGGVGKGRIYTVHDPKRINDPVVKQTTKLFKEGFDKRSSEELGKLLRHADMRVRLRAQFSLAKRGTDAIPLFRKIAVSEDHALARLHAVWG